MLRPKRQARGHTFDDLRDENVDFALPNQTAICVLEILRMKKLLQVCFLQAM
jgi:hypothetical protein